MRYYPCFLSFLDLQLHGGVVIGLLEILHFPIALLQHGIEAGHKIAAAGGAGQLLRLLQLPGGLQWVQLDLGAEKTVSAVCVWHDQGDERVYRDVIVHNRIRETGAVRELAAFLVENPGCRFTASKMLKPLNVASASTISQWCEWMQNAYLFFFVPVFSDSAKARMLNPKKVYCIDTGMEYAVSSRRLPNDGARFENLVFLAKGDTKNGNSTLLSLLTTKNTAAISSPVSIQRIKRSKVMVFSNMCLGVLELSNNNSMDCVSSILSGSILDRAAHILGSRPAKRAGRSSPCGGLHRPDCHTSRRWHAPW